MSRIKCLIVDDEELARELIESHLAQLDDFDLVASCASAIEASNVLKNNHIDLMFLDIEMPVLKGTDFYKNLLNKPKAIFTTAYRDYALDGFDLDAVDYLLKPIVFSRFFQAIERFLVSHRDVKNTIDQGLHAAQYPPPRHIFVRKDRKQVKLQLDQILYVQGLKDYVQVFLDNGSHIIKQGISAFEEQLGVGFLRTHRSYIVNQSKVTALTKSDVEIGDIEIPIGENFKSNVLDAFKT
ncbi:MAG: response regulator transcription factor [Arenicella sp.]|nr:response regulator transcription factor [Arenicella sp.]